TVGGQAVAVHTLRAAVGLDVLDLDEVLGGGAVARLAAVAALAVVLAAASLVLASVLVLAPAAAVDVRRDTLAAGEAAEVARRLAARAVDGGADAVESGRPLGLQRPQDGVADVVRVPRLGLPRLSQSLVGGGDLPVEPCQLSGDSPARVARHLGEPLADVRTVDRRDLCRTRPRPVVGPALLVRRGVEV